MIVKTSNKIFFLAIDPSLSSDECDTGIGMKLEIIDESREVPLVDKFPKRKRMYIIYA